MPRITRYVTFSQESVQTKPAVLNGIPRKTRAAVRKSLKEGLTSRREHSLHGKTFEDLYSRNLGRLGTPCFPAKHFATLLEKFRGMADIREVSSNGTVVAAVLTFYFRDQVLPYYGASDPKFNAIAPNNFMYYDLMRWAGQNGYRIFDFGRSKKVKGSYDFKAHWGMVERELPYEIFLVKGKKLPNFAGEPGFPPADLIVAASALRARKCAGAPFDPIRTVKMCRFCHNRRVAQW